MKFIYCRLELNSLTYLLWLQNSVFFYCSCS